MVPPLSECIRNPPVKDEVWDTCVKRSSIGLCVGGILGGVSSIFLGPGAVAFSMGLCTTLAVHHCRSLFTEEATKKKMKAEVCQSPPPLPSTIPCPELESKQKTSETGEGIVSTEEQRCVYPTYTFPSIIPIPERPFGRDQALCDDTFEDRSECTCHIVEKEDDCKDSKVETKSETNEDCTIPDSFANPYAPAAPQSTWSPTEIPVDECPPEESNKYDNLFQEPKCSCPPSGPIYFNPSEPECTIPPSEPNYNFIPAEPECTCPPSEPECKNQQSEPNYNFIPAEPKCTCPQPEMNYTYTPSEPKYTWPSTEKHESIDPEPPCTCKPQCTCR